MPQQSSIPHFGTLAPDRTASGEPDELAVRWSQSLLDRLERRVPPSVWSALTPEQRAALTSAAAPPRTEHLIDYRVSVPLGRKRSYYVTILVGRERRNAQRLAREGQTSLRRRSAFFGLALMGTLLAAMFGVFCLAYLLKSLLGINLFDRPSAFHPLYELFLTK